MKRIVRVMALVAAMSLLPVTPAHACSCAPGDARESLQAADAAIIGKHLVTREATTPDPSGGVSSGREVIHTFEVQEDFKVDLGDTVEVHSSADGASCGLEFSPGGTVAMFLRDEGGEWWSSLCEQISPDELRAAAAPLPAPDGTNPVRFLAGGGFGEGRLLALDERGKTLGYGFGERDTGWIDVCPGSKRSVEIVYRHRERARLVVRRLRDLRVERKTILPFDVWYSGKRPDPDALACANETGRKIFVLGTTRHEPWSRSRLIKITPRGISTVHRGNAFTGTIGARRAYLATGRFGQNIKAVNLRTGREKTVAMLRGFLGGLALDPSQRTLTVISSRWEKPSYLHLIELSSGKVRTKQVGAPDRVFAGTTAWTGRFRFVLLPTGGDNGHAVTFNRRLKSLGRFRWNAYGGVVHGGRAHGLTWTGELIGAELPDGPARTIGKLISRNLRALAVVPGRTNIEIASDGAPDEQPSP